MWVCSMTGVQWSLRKWLLEKLSTALSEELSKVCIVLWGIWHWRNQKVWDTKTVTPGFAMDNSFRMFSEWKNARKSQVDQNVIVNKGKMKTDNRWQAPGVGSLKVN